MKTNDLVVIAIPIYKESLSYTEMLSLNQCITILKKYPIMFIAPYELNTTAYEKICKNKILFQVKRFNNKYFKSIKGYNQFMLLANFYKTFLNYKFILIYQLDAFVFKDDLMYWCSQNYDYIGAPNVPHENLPNEIQVLKNYNKFLNFINKTVKTNFKTKNVGNGGLSLRKTQKCYWMLKFLQPKIAKWGTNNEDGFFKYWGNLLYPLFKLPSDEIALHFSIEHSPSESLKKLNNVLPFGCHAFEKYEWETWMPFIENQKKLPGN